MIRCAFGIMASLMLLLMLPAAPLRADDAYTDAVGRFTYAPPSGYTLNVKRSTSGYAVFTADRQQPYVAILSFLYSESSLDDYVARYLSDLKQDGTVVTLDDEPRQASVGGVPARSVDYLGTDRQVRVHVRATFVLLGNAMASIEVVDSVTDWDAAQASVPAFLDGFRFLTSDYPSTYTDATKRLTLALPLRWQRVIAESVASGKATREVFYGSPAGKCDVAMYPLDKGVTLEQRATAEVAGIRSSYATETSQRTALPTTIAGVPAYQWEFFFVLDNVRMHGRYIWAYSDTTRYDIYIGARDDQWDAALPQMTLLLESLHFGS